MVWLESKTEWVTMRRLPSGWWWWKDFQWNHLKWFTSQWIEWIEKTVISRKRANDGCMLRSWLIERDALLKSTTGYTDAGWRADWWPTDDCTRNRLADDELQPIKLRFLRIKKLKLKKLALRRFMKINGDRWRLMGIYRDGYSLCKQWTVKYFRWTRRALEGGLSLSQDKKSDPDWLLG